MRNIYPIVSLTNKKQIKRFYQSQHYSASFMGFDKSYQVLDDDDIIASAIISYQTKENNQALLHAIVVNKNYQNKGIAKQLITHICKLYPNIVCFCSPELVKLYRQCGFVQFEAEQLSSKNKERYLIYQKKKSLVALNYEA